MSVSLLPSVVPATVPPAAEAVLRFWFGDAAEDAPREAWFRKDAAFDAEIEQRFAAEIEAALRGRLDH